MSKTINWGIIGCGNIAHQFASDLLLFEKAKLQGVASRSQDKALAFAEKYNSAKYYSSYRELADDPEIDVVYIATPHTFHFENTMMCLQAGKAVLCEKPMGVNSEQVKTMIYEARLRKLFLMEAVWTRFIPATEKVLELIEKQSIGDISFGRADFGFKADKNPEGRVFNKKLGGGSLLDIGIYPIYLSLLMLGVPKTIHAMARMTETQVDSFCAMLFDYPKGEKAILESTVETSTPIEGTIYGTNGSIKIHSPFHHSKKITLSQFEASDEVFEIDYTGHGYYHEIEEVANCLNAGMTESKKLPHGLSLNLIKIIDQVKQIIGLKYDADLA